MNGELQSSTFDPPFADDGEHMAMELERLDLLLRLQLHRARGGRSGDAADEALARPPGAPAWSSGPLDADAVALAGRFEAAGAGLARRVAATRATGRALRLHLLAERCGLSPLERSVVLLALAPELDPRYEPVFAGLHGDPRRTRPSVQLALDLFTPGLRGTIDARERLIDPEGPLRRLDLVRLDARPGGPPARHELTLAPAVVRWLTGGPALDPAHRRLVAFLEPRADGPFDWPDELAARRDGIVERASAGERAVVWLLGPAGAGRRSFAADACARLGHPLLVVDGRRLAALAEADARPLCAAALLACLVDQAALCLVDADEAGPYARELGERAAALTFLCAARRTYHDGVVGGAPVEEVRLSVVDAPWRRRLWQRALPGLDAAAVATAAARVRLHPGQIRGAAATALGLARAGGKRLPGEDELLRAAQAHGAHQLGRLATRLVSAYAWDDLVLPPERLAQLRDVSRRLRHRARVLDEWGFGRLHVQARGLAVQFSGPPGTGKTMAAGVLAHELGRELFRVDLSQVVDKYIGETEKQLERVFVEAEATEVVLFFDEADALFGKRSAVHDAHDRYANTQVAYLLQRLETYTGLVILATNLRKNLDEAFARRVAVHVEFPLPDAAARAQIWARVWPREAPLAPTIAADDLARRFELSGGHIRNIAVGAAFAAAEDGRPIDLQHVLAAARAEYAKLSKLCNPGQFDGPAETR